MVLPTFVETKVGRLPVRKPAYKGATRDNRDRIKIVNYQFIIDLLVKGSIDATARGIRLSKVPFSS